MEKILKKGKRFKLMLGKFGTYFYDDYEGKDLTNIEVFLLLEENEDLKKKIVMINK